MVDMPQARRLCYENTSDDESLYERENLASSVNISNQISSSRDQLAHENGRPLALIKYLIWICFVSLIALALWIVFCWRQSRDVVELSTNQGLLNVICIVFIGVAYGICSAFCMFFDSAVPGNTPPSPCAHKKSKSRLIAIRSNNGNLDSFSPAHDDNFPSLQTVTMPVHQSGSVPIEYLMVPFNIVFVIVAVLLWLQNEMGVTIF